MYIAYGIIHVYYEYFLNKEWWKVNTLKIVFLFSLYIVHEEKLNIVIFHDFLQ